MDTDEKDLHDLLGSIKDLPTLPTVVTRLIGLVDDPESSTEDISQLIREDPPLTGKVLKLVNSPFYGFSRSISSVSEAVVILGLETIRNLALSASVFEVFRGEGTYRFDRAGFWARSIASGVAAETAAEQVGIDAPEEVMTAGILHQIGQLVMDQHLTPQFRDVLAYARDRQATMVEAEKAVLEYTHPEVGAWLARRWKLPDPLVAAIRHYHQPGCAPEEYRRLVKFTHLGDALARSTSIGWSGSEVLPTFQESVAGDLGLDKRDVQRVLDRIKPRMDRASVFLELSAQPAS